MNTTLEQYRSAARPLTAVVDAVPAEAWSHPSPCEDWTARDVVGHLVATQRSFLTERGVALGDAPDATTDPAAAWRAHVAQVEVALTDDAVPAVAFDGFFGPTTVGDTLVRFYVWDMVVHRWDVATAVGAGTGTTFTADELDRVEDGIAGFGDALYVDGICRPGVEAPADADRATRLLARLGRRTGALASDRG
ncbi:TIGR03086 family metal-binding protein [Cellulomonas sp. ATA003]|uniref:TIGR03086 family metal-binding protein n=1 Tax=Cellulomonas sp. ATA003 TaxID=3073064 RepID=UPI002873D2C7|nr:TIGR03086 family metal-binding protein [Cellulomonas sp. ATA003]WNB84408.1 TIGR03086 family metal-binding protein [Cellulomonas sp. ATA003]